MGTKKKIAAVVIDTNVVLSALLFRGELARLHDLWKDGTIRPIMSRDTFDELKRTLAYPKFKLTGDEIAFLLEEEILPFFEVIEYVPDIEGISRDPDDDIFIALALSGKAPYIITGDRDLLDISRYKGIRFVSPAQFLKKKI